MLFEFNRDGENRICVMGSNFSGAMLREDCVRRRSQVRRLQNEGLPHEVGPDVAETTLMADGTFKKAPFGFEQIYTVSGRVRN